MEIQVSKLRLYKSEAERALKNSKNLQVRIDAQVILELLREIERLREAERA